MRYHYHVIIKKQNSRFCRYVHSQSCLKQFKDYTSSVKADTSYSCPGQLRNPLTMLNTIWSIGLSNGRLSIPQINPFTISMIVFMKSCRSSSSTGLATLRATMAVKTTAKYCILRRVCWIGWRWTIILWLVGHQRILHIVEVRNLTQRS